MEKRRNWFLLALRILGAIFFVFIAWKFYRVGYQYGVAAWSSDRAFGFLKDWLPAVVGVMVGVVPGNDWERKVKNRYRVAIVLIGFIYSGVLYHAETLSNKENTKQLGEAVNQAVVKANDHSDGKFAGLQSEVGTLGGQVQSLGEQLGRKLGDINTSIGKTGKPIPPEPAKLQFSLFRGGLKEEQLPLTTMSVSPDANGNYKIGILAKNISGVSAQGIEVWLEICSECSFAKEPQGFDKPMGTDDHVRHAVFQELNGGVSIVRNDIEVKLTKPDVGFFVQVTGTCKNCGGHLEKSPPLKIVALPRPTPQLGSYIPIPGPQ